MESLFKKSVCHFCKKPNDFGYTLTLKAMFETRTISLCEDCYQKIKEQLFKEKKKGE